MKFTYYPGCSLKSTAQEYNEATMSIFSELGIQLEELEDWNCCGATSGHSTNKFLSYALPLRNLINAQKQGNDILAPCAACFNMLRGADEGVRRKEEEAERANSQLLQVMKKKYNAQIEVKHLLQVLTQEEVIATMRQKIEKPLCGLKLAAYYGCLLTRPPQLAFEDNSEQPTTMDSIIDLLGAESVNWTHKTECCGASLAISQKELVNELTFKILDAAVHAGAHAIVTACPLCHSNLDMRQERESKSIPVFYISEIIGLAMGIEERSWFKKHLVEPESLLKSLRLLSAS